MLKCSVDSCENQPRSRGLCNKHYIAARLAGTFVSHQRIRLPNRGCSVEQCGAEHYADGLCNKHWQRRRRNGDPLCLKNAPFGSGTVKNGYRMVRRAGHPNAQSQGLIYEHRLIMSEHLGRALTDQENVHHINGDTLDNRLENLELWSTKQPLGQRIPDKVAWAREILNAYAASPYEEDAHQW